MDQDVEGGVGAMGRSPLLEDRVELLVGLDVSRLDEARAEVGHLVDLGRQPGLHEE